MSALLSERNLRIGMVAGEMSGDLLGAGLIKAIKKIHPGAIFEGIGGEKMIAEGFNSLADQERLAVMGFVAPLKRLPELLKIRKRIVNHFLSDPPDVFIGIDSTGFNIPIERKFKQAGIKSVHYVSPQIWAWRQGRVHKIAKSVNLMLTLFPFEAKFYQEHDVPVTFVGHTLADTIPLESDKVEARRLLNLDPDKKLIALLPGSRKSEVELLGGEFLAAAQFCLSKIPELSFIIPAANQQRYSQIEKQLQKHSDLPVKLILAQSHQAMSAADVVLMASGTTTLEALLLKKPMVVAYKFPALSYAIYSRLLKIPHIALPNILAGRELVPELIQDKVSAESLGRALLKYFEDPELTNHLRQEYLNIHQQLKRNASERAAEAILDLIAS
ncbi:lipid-A-disaccharide synthase [Aurantivibrio infirmus]